MVCECSPDGCYLMTATTAPRLQVDNGIKIFHHNGALYFKQVFDKLYQADWKLESSHEFRDIAQVVNSVDNVKIEEGKGIKSSQTSAGSTSTNCPVQKPAVYRPPHPKTTAAIQAEFFGESPTETMSKNALKNKKKTEKQREKKTAEAASAGSSS